MEKINLNEGDTLYNIYKFLFIGNLFIKNGSQKKKKKVPPLNLTLDLFSPLLASDLSNFPLHHNATTTSLLLKQV